MPTLEFNGKHHIYTHHLTIPYRPFKTDKSRSCNPTGEDDNLIIHGDNLHALKALLPRYANRIKCIYIDPPYNTGNEGWVYNDNVNSPLMQAWLEKQSPVDNEDLERHDKWLCMMWPRLHLLKELLADDGAIFISIDENEVHHLRMLMDELFGEENIVECFIWRSRQGRGATSKNTSKLHEYVISYSKYANEIDFEPEKRIRQQDTRERLRQWGQGDRREDRPTMYFPVESQDFGQVYPIRPDGSEGRWRIAESSMHELIHAGLVEFERQSDGRVEAYRIYPAGTETFTAYPSVLESEIVKTTAHGSRMLKEILGPNKFPYPKPVQLLKEILSLCTNENDLILDSFAGSATTAHAVLALNEDDGGNRQFIMVECEDKFANSVTAERVRRVIQGVPNARDKQLKEGLRGSFAFCTLGEAIDVASLLEGGDLPSFSQLASYLLHTATGISASPEDIESMDDEGRFYSNEQRDYYLIYQPSLEFLRSGDAALNLERAERIRDKGRSAVVFAAAKYISQSLLTQWNITFCQLPYELGLGVS